MKPVCNPLNYLEYLVFRGLAFLINSIPLSCLERLANFSGGVLYFLLKKRRKTALDNLQAAFGNKKSPEELKDIAIGAMGSLAKLTFEFIRIPRMAKKWEQYVEIKEDDFLWACRPPKKGTLFIISHFGNWELMGIAAAAMGLPLHAIARPVKNRYVYGYIQKLRMLTGMKMIDKEGAVRKTIQCLKRNECVAALIDQHERQGGVWVDFFGRKASTTSLPAMLALKYDISVVPVFMYRKRLGYFEMKSGSPFPLIRSGDFEADITANTQQYMKCIEREVQKKPEDWLWMHRRWREPAGKRDLDAVI